jgi:predicted DNA-binding transcriptional regulator YafY
MATKNTDRRDYLIIRRIWRGDKPSQEKIKEYLIANGCRDINVRTFQRDLENIRSNYDLSIKYDPAVRGYHIDFDESTRDLDTLMRFVELAETTDALNLSLHSRRAMSPYITFSPAVVPAGAEHLRTLLSAAMNSLAVEFDHTKYGSADEVHYAVEPYMLKECDGRWYLFAYVPARGAFRTFGLDRISGLVVGGTNFRRLPEREREAERFNSVYGLVYMPDQKTPPAEVVSIEFSPAMIGHLEALPLHPTQRVEDNIVTLEVIINRELQNKILSYGEHARVLTPESLRETIVARLRENLAAYDSK